MERIVNVCLLMALFLLTQCNSAEGVVPTVVKETLPPPQVVETIIESATQLPHEDVEDETLPTPPTGNSQTRGQAVTPTSTVLQLPTATLAPSPTPIMYQVQAEDTLLGIALQHNSTVAELVALNPTINPDLLSIGQLIQLPQPTRLATSAANAGGETAVSDQLSIHQIVAYQTPVGSLWLLGEVINEGDVPVESVQVAIDLLDNQLTQLEQVIVWTAVSTIQPDSKAPFGVLISDPPETFAQPAATIVGGNVVVGIGSRYFEVTLLQTTVDQQGEQFQVTGQLQNDGSQTAAEIRLVATFYNEEQIITGFQQQRIDGVLGVGETAVFNFIAASPGRETSSAIVIIEAVALTDE